MTARSTIKTLHASSFLFDTPLPGFQGGSCTILQVTLKKCFAEAAEAKPPKATVHTANATSLTNNFEFSTIKKQQDLAGKIGPQQKYIFLPG